MGRKQQRNQSTRKSHKSRAQIEGEKGEWAFFAGSRGEILDGIFLRETGRKKLNADVHGLRAEKEKSGCGNNSKERGKFDIKAERIRRKDAIDMRSAELELWTPSVKRGVKSAIHLPRQETGKRTWTMSPLAD